MDLSEIESEYKKKLEIAEKKFIGEIKNKSLKEREIIYKEEVKKIRSWYSNKINKIIKSHAPKKEKKSSNEGPLERYKVKKVDIEISKIKKLKTKISLLIFKIKIILKNHFDSIYYPNIAYNHKKLKYIVNQNYKAVKTRTIRLNKRFSKKMSILIDKIKYISHKIYEFPSKIWSLIRKQPKKEDKKTEEKPKQT